MMSLDIFNTKMVNLLKNKVLIRPHNQLNEGKVILGMLKINNPLHQKIRSGRQTFLVNGDHKLLERNVKT